MTLKIYTGDIQFKTRGNSESQATLDIREALRASIMDGKPRVLDANYITKNFAGNAEKAAQRIRQVAVKDKVGTKVGTDDTGTGVAFMGMLRDDNPKPEWLDGDAKTAPVKTRTKVTK